MTKPGVIDWVVALFALLLMLVIVWALTEIALAPRPVAYTPSGAITKCCQGGVDI